MRVTKWKFARGEGEFEGVVLMVEDAFGGILKRHILEMGREMGKGVEIKFVVKGLPMFLVFG
jgi:hypothetical protein